MLNARATECVFLGRRKEHRCLVFLNTPAGNAPRGRQIVRFEPNAQGTFDLSIADCQSETTLLIYC